MPSVRGAARRTPPPAAPAEQVLVGLVGSRVGRAAGPRSACRRPRRPRRARRRPSRRARCPASVSVCWTRVEHVAGQLDVAQHVGDLLGVDAALLAAALEQRLPLGGVDALDARRIDGAVRGRSADDPAPLGDRQGPPLARSSIRRWSQPSNHSAAAAAAIGVAQLFQLQPGLGVVPDRARRRRCRDRSASCRRTAAAIRLRASASGSTSRSATAARSSTSRASGSARLDRRVEVAVGVGRGRGTPGGGPRRANSSSTSHPAIDSQSWASSGDGDELGVLPHRRAPRRARRRRVGRRVRCSATRTRSATGSPTSEATWPAYSLRTLASGCSLTTAIARSASRARSSGVRAGCAVHHPLQAEGEERRGVGDGGGERLRVALGQVAGILAAGQAGDRHLHLVLLLPLVEPLGRALAGGVGVERQHDPAGVALEQPHVVLGERRAARRHRPRHAGLVEADHVGVALAHDDLVGRGDVGLRPVQPVERLRLGVDRRLRRVLVLRRIGRAGQDPPADRHRLAGVGEDREQHPGPEGVLQPVAPVGERQPGRPQQLAVDARLPRQGVPVVGRPAELERAGDVAGQPPRAQVVAGRAGRRVLEQPLVVPLDGRAPSPRRAACAGPARGTARSTCR